MKTGLVTFYHIHHYGALLQAYATERAVEALAGPHTNQSFIRDLVRLQTLLPNR